MHILSQDDMYESLQVYFDTVSRIEILTEGWFVANSVRLEI
jgi:hypothetical protein